MKSSAAKPNTFVESSESDDDTASEPVVDDEELGGVPETRDASVPVQRGRFGLGKAGCSRWQQLQEQANERSMQDSEGQDTNQQDQQYDGPLNLDYIVREYKRIYNGDLQKHGLDLKRNMTAIAEMVIEQLGQVRSWHFFTMTLSKRARLSKATPAVAVPDLGYRKILNYYFDFHEKKGRVNCPAVMAWWALVYTEKNPPESESKQRRDRSMKLGWLEEVLFRFLCNQETQGLGSAFLLKLAEAAGPENLEVLRRSDSPLLKQAKEYLRENWSMWCKPISLPAFLHRRLILSINEDDERIGENDSDLVQAYKSDRQRFSLDDDDESTARPCTSRQCLGENPSDVVSHQDVHGRHGLLSTCLGKYLTPDEAEAAAQSHDNKIQILRNQLASVNASISTTELDIKKHKKLLKKASQSHMTLLRRYRSLRQLDKVTPDSKIREETQIRMINAVARLLQINSSSGGVTEEDIVHSVEESGFKLLQEDPLPGPSNVSVATASTSLPCESVSTTSSKVPCPAITVETVRAALHSVKHNENGSRASGELQPCTSKKRARQGEAANMGGESISNERSARNEYEDRDRRSKKSHSSRKSRKPKKKTRAEKMMSFLFGSSDSDSSIKEVFKAKENLPRKTTPMGPLQNMATKKPNVREEYQTHVNSGDVMEVTLSSDSTNEEGRD